MMKHEFEEAYGKGVSWPMYQLIEAVYASDEAIAIGGHEGHVAVAKWAKKNEAHLAAMAAVVDAKSEEIRQAHATTQAAVEAGYKQEQTVKGELYRAEAELTAARQTIARYETNARDDYAQIERLVKSNNELASDAMAARHKLAVLGEAAAILEELKTAKAGAQSPA